MAQFRSHKRRTLSTEASLKMAFARKQVKKLSVPRDEIEAFVLRRSPLDNTFLWQIRLFGGVVLLTSDVCYPTWEAARDAGVMAQVSYRRRKGATSTSSVLA